MKPHLFLIALLCVSFDLAAHDLEKLERSFWLNASLAAPKRGYWGAEFPEPKAPTAVEIANAARVLMQDANPNRLYLIHHHELPAERTMQLFRDWRKAVPAAVEIVPALVLRMYDKTLTPVFAEAELQSLITFFKAEIHPHRIAVYDVLPNRDQGSSLAILSQGYEGGLIRVGLQPDEKLAPPFVAAVEDTWSGFCHGKTNDDWQELGFGRDTLRLWVNARNEHSLPIAYDLIVVAWDYDNTKRGEYPGYDDAHKNMPLPAGRNRLAVDEILTHAKDGVLAGFSSDLLIVELNSETKEHDGAQTFYTTLKSGQSYTGYYSAPWREVCTLFKSLADGKR